MTDIRRLRGRPQHAECLNDLCRQTQAVWGLMRTELPP